MNEDIKRLTNRHIGKLLDDLDEIGTSNIIKESIMRSFWRLSKDVDKQVLSKEQVNGKNSREYHPK